MTETHAGSGHHGVVYDSITDIIGNTPLVRIGKLAQAHDCSAEILLKLEFDNPLASIKDRIGLAMIDALEADGKINEDTVLIEPTSGNTGIALAFVCAARGYKLILCMPESMSIERRKMLALLGAQLELTPAEKGMVGAVARADEMIRQNPNAVMPQQFENPANPAIHERTTGEEIWRDTGGKVDALIAGVGTGGSLTGCVRALRKHNPDLIAVAVEPEDSAVLSGRPPGPHKIQGIGAGFVPGVLDSALIDEVITIGNESAFEMSRQLARLEGIPAGISTGANLAAAIEMGRRPDMAGKTLVTFAPSFAERYLSTALFDGV